MDERQTLQLARKAIRQGDKATARKLLSQVVQSNPRSEVAWLWLSAIVDDPTQERDCLNQVLNINPDNEIATRHLERLDRTSATPSQPTSRLKVSIVKAIQSDYLSMLSVLAPTVFWALYIDSQWIGVFRARGRPGNPIFFLVLALSATMVFSLVLALRLESILSHFENGVEVEGVIKAIWLSRGRGRVAYRYQYQGKPYQSGNAIHRTEFARSLQKGQKVRLVVRKDKPDSALIKEMYIKDS